MISLVRKRTWKPSNSDNAFRVFVCCGRSADHGKQKIKMPVAVVDCQADAHVEHH